MSNANPEWSIAKKIIYWLTVVAWVFFVGLLYSPPTGVLGNISKLAFDILTPKYVTLTINTFSIVGVYVVTRLILSAQIRRGTVYNEIFALILLILVSLTSVGLWSARCDIYVFCSEDIPTINVDCESGWDRQGQSCQ